VAPQHAGADVKALAVERPVGPHDRERSARGALDLAGAPASDGGRWFYGHTGGTPGYVTFAAGTVDGRRMFVVAVNGVDRRAMEAMMGRYLDDLLCRA
jgi:hypothetical protein